MNGCIIEAKTAGSVWVCRYRNPEGEMGLAFSAGVRMHVQFEIVMDLEAQSSQWSVHCV